MSVFRDVDVLVCGGGPSGCAAALAAARGGARTLLVERYGRLGGAGVTSMVNPLMGEVACPLVDDISHRFLNVEGGDWEVLDLVYADLLEEAGVEILLHSWVAGVVMRDASRVGGVRVLNKQGMQDLVASVVVDATADGDVAFAAGCAFEKGRPGDGLMQPMTIMFRLGAVDKATAPCCASEEEAHALRLPDGRTWEQLVHAAADAGDLPGNVRVVRVYESPRPHERIVNATQVNYVDGTDIADLTRAELEGRRQARSVARFVRAHLPGYGASYISHMPQAVGVRETRRFHGLARLEHADVMAGRKFDDAVVRNAHFPLDIHNPDGGGQAHGSGFAQRSKPYDIPLGCLIPQSMDGLVLAGRCISGSHEAHASYRVQRIAMAIGAAAGAVACLASRVDTPVANIKAQDVRRALRQPS